jgi:hypothetical protein
MTSTHVFEFFRQLSEEEQEEFVAMLGLWCDLHWQDADFVIIKKAEYARLKMDSAVIDHDALYEVAKKVTLEQGWPWTDPRTGEKFEP